MATEYSKGDLVMFVGDFNINAAPLSGPEITINEALHAEQAKRIAGTVKK